MQEVTMQEVTLQEVAMQEVAMQEVAMATGAGAVAVGATGMCSGSAGGGWHGAVERPRAATGSNLEEAGGESAEGGEEWEAVTLSRRSFSGSL